MEPGPYYSIQSESTDGGCYESSSWTAGPWSERFQHGGPPNALLISVAERVAADGTGRADLSAARLASEFLGPVPVANVQVQARVVRAARAAVLVEATLRAGDRVCLQSRIWLLGASDTGAVAAPGVPPVPRPPAAGLAWQFPYGATIDWRAVEGSIAEPGPGRYWARPTVALLTQRPDERWSGLARVALIGDSASGISSALDWREWSFPNIDLDIHLARPVVGEWVLLDAQTQPGPAGFALCRSTVSDQDGVCGLTAQTLVLAPGGAAAARA